MTNFLLRRFVPDYQNTADPAVREKYGNLAGIVGIICNVLLFAGKLLAGTLCGSVSVTADAVNNLSDASSSLVTLLGFRLAGPTRNTPTATRGWNTCPASLWP